MTVFAPVRLSEAGSLAKASSPEPFSASTTSNWVARRGGLPPYVQHIAHDLMADPKHPRTESEAIKLAVGIVKNPPDDWHAEAKAAAAKAAAEWEAKKGPSKPGSAVASTTKSVAESISLADRVRLRTGALARLGALKEAFGVAGMLSILEAKGTSWSPELKPTASAPREAARFAVHDGGQQVGTIASRKSYDKGKPDSWEAMSVNGSSCSSSANGSKAEALDMLEKHLAEGPARVLPHAEGKYLVAKVASYGGKTSYEDFPNKSAARYAAGLPEERSTPEVNSEVDALGEMIAFDWMTLSGLREELPTGMRVLSEEVAEAFAPFEPDKHPRGPHGKFVVGDRVNFQHSSFGRVPAEVTKVTSRRVFVKSSDPRVSPTSMTHKQAESKLSVTRGRSTVSPSAPRASTPINHKRVAERAAKASLPTTNAKAPVQVEKGSGSEFHVRNHEVNGGKSLPMSETDAHKRATELNTSHIAELQKRAPAGIHYSHTRKADGTHMISVGKTVREGKRTGGVLGGLLDMRLQEAALTAKARNALPKDDFVYPDKAPGSGSYPIDTRARAVAALARASDPANSGDLSTVQAKVYARYPELKQAKGEK